jgi:hypothetical protein
LFAAIFCQPKVSWANEESLSSYPPVIYNIMAGISKWAPSPGVTANCKLTFSSKQLIPENCLADYKLGLLDRFKSNLLFDYDISDHSKFQKIIIEPKSGLKIRGLLALHKGQKKPLVIFRMGIHGNIDEFLAERFLFKLIHQDLGYHVLVLESLTSHGFLKLNDLITVGGFEEGLHTFYVIQKILSHQFNWADDVTEIHLAGVSMSGSGLFLAAYLDEQNQHKIKSVQAFCPLINLQKTFEYHSRPGWFSVFFDLWNSRRLKLLYKKNPELDKISLWPELFDQKPRFTPAAFAWLNQKSAQPLLDLKTFKTQFPEIKFPADFVKHIENSKTLYELNNFWPVFKNQKTPIQVYYTPNDPAVVNFLNTDLILSGKQPGDFTKTKFTELQGVHCALASEYQWPFLVEMVRRGLQN